MSDGILPGIYIEDLRDNALRVRGQQSIENDDTWVVFGFERKKCVSAQGFRFKENAENWQKRLEEWKFKTRIFPRSKVHLKED